MAPPTKMDAKQLTEEGHYGTFGTAGARMEMPGCSLCMGNQAQVKEGATVFSTSTRNFPNRLGKNSNVYLGSAELARSAPSSPPTLRLAKYSGRLRPSGSIVRACATSSPATTR
jgi:aconitase B